MQDNQTENSQQRNLENNQPQGMQAQNTQTVESQNMQSQDMQSSQVLQGYESYKGNQAGGMDQPSSHEAGVFQVLNSSATNLTQKDKQTANYLLRQMLYEQQEKVDPADISVNSSDSMEVRDTEDKY